MPVSRRWTQSGWVAIPWGILAAIEFSHISGILYIQVYILLSYMAWAFIQSATTACIISHYKKKSTLFDCRVFLSEETIEYYMVHLGGFILDLTVGFWLLWPKSRPLALFFATSFHMMNAQLFTIGIYSSLLFTTLRWKGGKKLFL